MHRTGLAAFTLVELLVVIAVIVVLLALLAPALDTAVYQAELARCAANQDAVAVGVIGYAVGARSYYPYRQVIDEGIQFDGRARPWVLRDASGNRPDDRPRLRSALGNLKVLNDPLSPKIDLDEDLTRTGRDPTMESNYALWFGMRYVADLGGRGMFKLGDRLEWRDDSRGRDIAHRFDTLVSEWDQVWDQGNSVLNPHPDKTGVLSPYTVDYDVWTESGWASAVTWERGPTDANAAFADGAVIRFADARWDDDRMARVPYDAFGTAWAPAGNSLFVNMPIR